MYDKMEEPSDDENDMLDLAFGLTETSRLGCQVQMSKGLDGLVVGLFHVVLSYSGEMDGCGDVLANVRRQVKLPSMTRNMQASDFEKK
jgi:hypothetical protein